MSYYDISELSGDSHFIARTAACYSVETADDDYDLKKNPSSWAMDHNWDMASQPGFGEAYTYARETDVVDPGKDPGVITDAQILAAVQSIMTKEEA